MIALAVKEKMFYCPKCQQTYDDGSQRFCNNDGGRLLPAPGSSNLSDVSKSPAQTGGIFTNLIGKTESSVNNDEKLASLPRFVKSEQSNLPVYEVPVKNRLLDDDTEIELELEPTTPRLLSFDQPAALMPQPKAVKDVTQNQQLESSENLLEIQTKIEPPANPIQKPKADLFPEPAKPVSRIINPKEIHSGTASVGNRKTNPAGRNALGWNNTSALLGSLVKGRYLVGEKIEQDETSVSYLAEDQLAQPRKVVVRVILSEDSEDEFVNTIYSEERISLAHVDHPNIVKVIDSGELQEGKQFVITEFIEADSVAEVLKKGGQFNTLRTARIIRQIAYALSEAHQNGILHRNLKPENLLLDVSEVGTEQVKLTHFGVSGAGLGDLDYKAPEILEGKLATFAGDVYSLAVIAYQMLTNRLPFQGENARQLLKLQREGLRVHPTNLRLDLPLSVDTILEKAMSYQATERYPNARDFGDAFFNSLTDAPLWKDKEEKIETAPAKTKNEIVILPVEDLKTEGKTAAITDLGEINKVEADKSDILPVIGDLHISPREENKELTTAQSVEISDAKNADPTWTRRSPEPPQTASNKIVFFSFLGLTILLLGLWGIWMYFLNRPAHPEVPSQTETAVQTRPTIATVTPGLPQNSAVSTEDMDEIPPISRQIIQPPNTVFFQNSKQEAKGSLLKNFLGFSVYYPKDWQVNETKEIEKAGTRGKFLDISRNNETGTPIEKMLISYYDSKGTFKADLGNFPVLVKETNETLKKIVPNYQMLSEGEIKINGDWKAYEIKFQGGGETATGEKLNLWGRRLFIPMARPGMRSGYEITMFATSLSPEVKSVDDVGIKGELGTILETFEPNQNF